MNTRQLVAKLKAMKVVGASLNGNSVTLTLSGVPIEGHAHVTEKIEVVTHEDFVASWTKSSKLRIDNDTVLKDAYYKDRYKLSLAIHEAVEKFVYNNFFSNKNASEVYPYPIHVIAEHLEKKYHIHRWGVQSWNMYSDMVSIVFNKENKI